MDEKYHIVKVDNPEESAWGIIGRGVGDFNKQQAGDDKFKQTKQGIRRIRVTENKKGELYEKNELITN